MEQLFKFSSARQLELDNSTRVAITEFLQKINSGDYQLESTRCLCGADDDILLTDIDRYGIPVNTVICRNCGLLRINPYLDQRSLEKFYDTDYDKIYRNEIPVNTFFKEQLNQGNEILNKIESVIPLSLHPAVMEIGCSMGGNLLPFQQRGCAVFGTDYNHDHVEKGKKIGLDLRIGSWEKLQDVPPADVMILSHVLEHMKDPKQFLKEVLRLIKKDGLIYIAVPAVEDIPFFYGYDIMKWLQNAHAYNFSNMTLKELITLCGAEPIWDNGKGTIIARNSQKPEVSNFAFDTDESTAIIRKLINYEHKFHFHKLLWFMKMFLPYGMVQYFRKCQRLG